MRFYQKIPLAVAIRQASPRPTFEFSEEKVEKLKTFSNIVLGILSVAGIATIALIAPNALQALELFEKRKGHRKLRHSQKVRKVSRVFYYLRERGFVEFRQKGEDFEVSLTKRGKKQIRRLDIETLSIPRPKSWDGKFWQVAADIPTKKYRRGADALRSKLKQMGFYPLQRTLWFYPFDPRIEIEFIVRHYGIVPFVTVMKIAELDPSDERILKRFFKQKELI